MGGGRGRLTWPTHSSTAQLLQTDPAVDAKAQCAEACMCHCGVNVSFYVLLMIAVFECYLCIDVNLQCHHHSCTVIRPAGPIRQAHFRSIYYWWNWGLWDC